MLSLKMKRKIKLFLFLITLLSQLYAKNYCIECHKGIEDIRDKNSLMFKEILKKANNAGYKGNDCIVCHGGNPDVKTKQKAHKGTISYFKTNPGPKEFYPDPGSPWINQNTCGMCHKEQVMAQTNSLMMSEQGKIQGALWSFGKKEALIHNLATYDSKNPTDPHKRLGTKIYRKYMQELKKLEPNVYPNKNQQIPKAPTADEVENDPSLAVYTYLRQECLRCHTGSKGRYKRGDYRGMGCSSCHIPYSNEGFYEGGDPTINKNESGHLLTHQIQASRDAKVHIHNHTYSGVPVETCTTCHNRGKRIGVSYQGLMETPYNGAWGDGGSSQPKLHTKRYIKMHEDIHYKKGMLCQDCHTSNDLHGDGFISGTNLAAVEIECEDCHGTTQKYPWELPLGYSDEFGKKLKDNPRGVTKSIASYLKKGFIPKDTKDGFLLTAIGNPYTNVIKDKNEVIVYLASGKTITLKPLKLLKEQKKLSKEALVAMDKIKSHTKDMECYSCHAKWAPQCYGCHVKIDYSGGKKNIDYLAASHDQDIHGTTGGYRKELKKYLIDGKVTETRSYLRWEDPILVENGEGKISPAIPGCQVVITVIGKDGKTLLKNHIYKVQDNNQNVNSLDMSPVNPHTISKEARSCESCHTNPKAMGFGIYGTTDFNKNTTIDLEDANKNILPKKTLIQFNSIPNLEYDFSQILDKNLTQLMTVGHHFKLSRALNKEELEKLDRRGVCFSCHQDIPKGDLAVSLMTHIADVTDLNVDNKKHNKILNKTLKLSAWIQIGGIVLLLLFIIIYLIKRSKK